MTKSVFPLMQLAFASRASESLVWWLVRLLRWSQDLPWEMAVGSQQVARYGRAGSDISSGSFSSGTKGKTSG